MSVTKYLAILPFVGILVGVIFMNRTEPLILGLPLILAWLVLWILLTSAIMAVVYYFDPANRTVPSGPDAAPGQEKRS